MNDYHIGKLGDEFESLDYKTILRIIRVSKDRVTYLCIREGHVWKKGQTNDDKSDYCHQ